MHHALAADYRLGGAGAQADTAALALIRHNVEVNQLLADERRAIFSFDLRLIFILK